LERECEHMRVRVMSWRMTARRRRQLMHPRSVLLVCAVQSKCTACGLLRFASSCCNKYR